MHTTCRRPARQNSRSGFTLIEVLLAAVLGIFIAGAVTATSAIGIKHLQGLKNLDRLHAAAIFLDETLSYRVKDAVAIDITPNPTSTLIIFAPDLSTTTIALAGGNVTVDGDPILPNDVTVTGLSFQKIDRSARMSFTVRIPASGSTFSATTTYAMRNLPT